MTYEDKQARDRVVRFINDHFDAEDIAKIDKIIRGRSGATMDRSVSVNRGMTFDRRSFEQRYPGTERIGVAEVRR